jgi:hypothetical protein
MLLIQTAKRKRCGDESKPDTKRSRNSLVRQTAVIEDWLDESCWSRKASTENDTPLPELSGNMSRKPAAVLPSPGNSFESTISRRSERSTASVHNADYYRSLGYHKIYIESESPPTELMRRAQRITTRSRTSPEIDDAAVQELIATSRRLRNDPEDAIIRQLASQIIPSMNKLPDQRLEMSGDQPWFNSVAVSLDPDVLMNPLPLPRPKPDLAFGFSEAAFNHKQLRTIDLLVDDQFGRSYVMPDQKLRFPFLDIEFKSQAKNGTHYVATNQVAGAGAIALNGNIELIQRSSGMEGFDYTEPRFFSMTMDHQLACINVHWVRAPDGDGQYSFHVEGLSQHLLKDADGIRAVNRAIKNIIDYGADTQLRTLCSALDAYRDKVLLGREALRRPGAPAVGQVTTRQKRTRTSNVAPQSNHRHAVDAMGPSRPVGPLQKPSRGRTRPSRPEPEVRLC